MDLTLLREEVAKLIEEAKLAYADKTVSISEVIALLIKAISAFMTLYKTFADNVDFTQAGAKVFIIESVSQFYDSVIRPMDIPGVPNFLENTIVDPMLGKAVPAIVSALYDAVLEYIPGIHNNEPLSTARAVLGLPPVQS